MTQLKNIRPFLVHTPYWTQLNIQAAEQHYGAIYMGPWCLKDRNGNWSEDPVEVFYQPNPNVEAGHSHYLGLFCRPHEQMAFITNAESAFSEKIVGCMGRDSEVIVSRYRHNFIDRGSFFIDGGRDYTRVGGMAGDDFHMVDVQVKGPDFFITLDGNEYPCSTILPKSST